jgi:RecB family exonuclease
MRGQRRTLIVLPDADRVEHALFEAAQAHTFVDGRGFTTFSRLHDWCAPAKRLGRKLLPELTARLILSAFAAKAAEHPWGAWAREPGFAREAQRLIAHLKGQRSTPAELKRAAERLTDTALRARAVSLAELWQAYEKGLLNLALADREDLTEAAIAALGEGLPAPLAEFQQIVVRHLYDWPPLRLGLVTALARACHKAGVEFLLELPRAHQRQVDALTDEAFAALEQAGADDAAFAEGVELVTGDTHRWAVDRLFGERRHDAELQGLAAFSAATAADELREIARRVRAALDAGASPEHVAVAFRDLADEAEAMVAALAEKGVAARTRRGVPLAATALGRLALELPRLIDDHFPAGQLAHFLESRYVRAASTESDPGPIFRAAGIRDDALGAQPEAGAYKVRLEQLAARSKPGEASRCRQLVKDVENFKGLCAPLGRAKTLEAQLEAWALLVETLGLLDGVGKGEALVEGAPALARAAERALAQDQAASQALGTLAQSLKQALKVSKVGKAPATLAGFARWLADAAADLNLDARGVRSGAVRVLDLRELFGRPLTHLFVGAVLDGRLPSRPTAASLLSDAARVALNKAAGRALFRVRAGEGDDRLLTREAEDRLLFVHALGAAGQVTLSHARLDGEGKSALPSAWLHGLTHGRSGLPLHRLPLGLPPPLDLVHAPRELRQRVALEALSDERTRLTPRDGATALMARAFEGHRWFRAARDIERIERERFEFFEREDQTAGAHSGGLHGPAVAKILQRRLEFSARSPLSVSELKVWGNCAFAGFAEHLLKLRAPDQQGEELGGKERGTWLHKVLELLLPRLHGAGLLGLPRDAAAEAKIAPHLEAALDAAADEIRRSTPLGNPVLWELSRASARRAVLRVVAGNNGLPFEGQAPDKVEQRFGKAGDDLGEVVFPAAHADETDVHLVGKIDRIDAADGRAGVLDYKSSVRQPGELKKEFLVSEFQLPIYLHAVRQARPGVAVEAAWQTFKDGGVVKLERAVDGELDLERLLASSATARNALEEHENLGNALHGLLRRLRSGQLGPRPLDCKWCDYQRVCRLSDRRLTAEDGDGP